jgi:hypothetical protein
MANKTIEVKREYWDDAKTKLAVEIWYRDSEIYHRNRHRLDGPALQTYWSNGQKEYEVWYRDGKYHRLDGIAYQRWYENGQKEVEIWYRNDKYHRLDGPAYQSWWCSDSVLYHTNPRWFINGIEYTEEEFNEYVKGLDSKEDLDILVDLGQTF